MQKNIAEKRTYLFELFKDRGISRIFLYLFLSAAIHLVLILGTQEKNRTIHSGSALGDKNSHTILITILPSREPLSRNLVQASSPPTANALHPDTESKQNTSTAEPPEIPVPSPQVQYFESKELTRQAKPRGSVAFDTPDYAIMPEAGKVQIRMLINKFGIVDEAIIESSTLPEIFSEAVKRAFSRVKFDPGEIDGEAVPSQFQVEINYETNGTSP